MSDGQPNLPARELQELKAELRFMQQRLNAINHRLDTLAQHAAEPAPPPSLPVTPPPLIPVVEPPASVAVAVVECPPVLEAPPELPPPPPPAPEPLPAAPRESFEVRLGTFWLPRIGMTLLLLGMVFFVTWSYHHMGKPGRVALSYAACAVLGGLGWWLEKRMPQFARVLQAGALALAYFVTYAIRHVERFQVIHSDALGLALLSAVVAGTVFVADRRKSATLAGLALFFGYLTTVISDVAPFTLAANAVLVGGALWFLARNRWVGIAYGAVLATYLAYTLWVWKLNRFGDLERIIFNTAYLGDADFRLRASFLCLYWVLFTVGGLLVRRDVCAVGERNGLLILNNAFYFILFTLLMHHAHPGDQWVFQFGFGGALLIASAIAYQRYQPERVLMDTLFLQGVALATLGLISKLKGVHLVGALAVESLFLLWLARAMNLRWIAWLGRSVFGIAAVYAWSRLPNWNDAMVLGVLVTAVVGVVSARLTKPAGAPLPVTMSALYYAVVAVVLAMTAAGKHFERPLLPWIWPVLAGLFILAGVLLRTREVVWLGNLPLLYAHVSFHLGNFGATRFEWTVAQGLALVTVTLGLGLLWWGRTRASGDETQATERLLPYALAATLALIGMAVEQCPQRIVITVLGVEGLVLLLAGLRLREPVLRWLAVLPLAWAHGMYYSNHKAFALDQCLGLVALTLGAGLLLWARQQADETEPDRAGRATSILWPFALAVVALTVVMTFDFVPKRFQLPVFAGQGAVLVLCGVPALRTLGIVPFLLGTLVFVGLRKYRLGEPVDAWLSLVLGWLCMILAARVLRLRALASAAVDQTALRLRTVIVTLATVVLLFGLQKLVQGTLLTVAWAAGGFLLLALGFTVRERTYRIAGLVVLTFSLARVFFYDLAKVETVYRILSFIGLGAILLFLAYLYTRNRERIVKWL
jgi:uncharacterized membrane protein